MAPFGLPQQLYTSSLPLAALAAQQRESQAAVAHSVTESSMKQRFLQGNMVAAPSERKIAMYSRVGRCSQGGGGVLRAIIGPPPRSRAADAPGTARAMGWSLWNGPLAAGHKGLPRADGTAPGGRAAQPPLAAAARRQSLDPLRLTFVPAPPNPPLQDFYVACSLGGIVACGLTHTMVTPLDVVKCNMQTDPKNYTGE